MESDSRADGRGLKRTVPASRLTGVALLVVALFLAVGLPVQADGGIWCISDPVVHVAGLDVQVLVAIPAEYQAAVTGPIAVSIVTGSDVDRSLVATDSGFNGYGERVQFVTLPGLDNSMLIVKVQVPVSTSVTRLNGVPMQLVVNSAAGDTVTVQGSSWVTVGSLRLNAASGSASSQ
jgi:hypothetical protein